MYAGHLAVALGATKARRRVPLWLLLIAAEAPDWLELLIKAAGRDNVNEVWSHSIPVVAIGGLLFASYYYFTDRDRAGAVLLIAVALSHPLLDLVTGSKALWPGTAPVGACVYDQPALDFLIEGVLAVIGWAIYRSTLGRRRSDVLAWAVLATLIGSQAALDAAQELRILRTPSVGRQCLEAERN